MRRKSKVFQLLGLARRAGAVAPGTDAVRQAIRSGDARLVLVASDASSGQMDKVRRTLQGRAAPSAEVGTQLELGAAVGLAPLSAVAVTDPSLAHEMLFELGDPVHISDSVAGS